MAGQSVERSLDFRGSGMRLLRTLRPQRTLIIGTLLLALASVVLAVIGPKILGRATDIIFAGVLNPEAGIDFDHVGRVLLFALGTYVGASVLSWVQGRWVASLVQSAVFDLRDDSQAKLSRLPLSYFDRQSRGEVLSRVTNDIDNLQQSLSQTLSQIVTSLLTIVGVLAVMIVISPLLALIALVTVPLSIWVAATVGKRAQPQFIQQWKTTGRLNGHIEEMYSGHSLVKVFGRQAESAATFEVQNEELYASSFKAQFISGLIQPAMIFIGNINYVLVAVVGGLRVSSGHLSLGDVQASSSTPGSSASPWPRWPAWRTCCSPGWPRRNGCSPCWTPRSSPRIRSTRSGWAARAAGSSSTTSRSGTTRTCR